MRLTARRPTRCVGPRYHVGVGTAEATPRLGSGARRVVVKGGQVLNVSDLEAIEERMTRLEREVRIWKRAAIVTLFPIAALIAFSLTPRNLVAKSLKIVDQEGTTRIVLGVDKDGPIMGLSDEAGTTRAILFASKDDAAVQINDQKGTPRARMAADKDGPQLLLVDQEGTPRLEELLRIRLKGPRVRDHNPLFIFLVKRAGNKARVKPPD
jgi:hypothetical protein